MLFLNDPTYVGNLNSGSSAFSKSSLNIWRFTVHIQLKPGLEDLDNYFANVWDEFNCAVVWTFFGIRMKTDLFQSCNHCWAFQICWHIECSTFTASSFWIWNSSTGIPSPPLALFVVMLPKPTWLCIPQCLALAEWSHHTILVIYKGNPFIYCESSNRSLWSSYLSKKYARTFMWVFLCICV